MRIAAACILVLLVCTVMTMGRNFRIGYAHAEQYNIGETVLEDTVKNLDIDWTSGIVKIAYHDKSTVEISESAQRSIRDSEKLRWWLDGDTLHIRYAKPRLFSFFSMQKELAITLPESIKLNRLEIRATSTDVDIPALKADDVAIELTSGNLALVQAGETNVISLSSTSGDLSASLEWAKTVSISTSSGGIMLEQTGITDSAVLSSTSGNIRMTLDNTETVSVSTTSGDIAMNAEKASKISMDSTSGRIDVNLCAFDNLKINVTSGDVTAVLPSEPGFSAEIDTTSGSFESAIALRKEGNRYTCGDGSAKVQIDTTSGDVRLEEAGQ